MRFIESAAGALLVGLAVVSAVLSPGASIPLPSSTAATEPDLGGVVVHDELIPFAIKNAGGRILCRGQLQDRVVRSTATGLLHFYYRIRGGGRNQPGRIRTAATLNFGTDTLSVAYRTDGLGTVNPTTASRSPAGELVQFDFKDPLLSCNLESRFFFIKTRAKEFGPGGETKLTLVTGEEVALKTVMPVP